MAVNEYAHLSPTRLRELAKQLTRSEQDTQERLAAREQQVRNLSVESSDPVRKRLLFLLLKQRRHRRAAERALATHENSPRWSTS